MVVADIGAGTGYLSRRMAPAVEPGGKVFAVDVQPQMVACCRQVAKRSRARNDRAACSARWTTCRLPAGSVDLAIMVDVYHELAFPYEVLASLVRALKPGGRIVFVEYRAEDPFVPIKALHKMSEAQVKREAAVFPLRVGAHGAARCRGSTWSFSGVADASRASAAPGTAPSLERAQATIALTRSRPAFLAV